jgi:outer membrane protein OmpA-like peptidoglycan-associated protein
MDIYYFELYEAARQGKTIYVKGKVYDAQTKLPLEAEVEAIDLHTKSTVVKWVSNKKDGSFLICLPVNKNYAFSASRQGYLFNSKNFSLLENKEYQPFVVNIPLHPISASKDSVFVLSNVFFDTDKYTLREESKVELDKLADFLTKNPSLKIELGGHTDNVGDKRYNQVLSENRAKAVCDYLIGKGIVKERLKYKGYGDTKPMVPNDSDEHRQMNRRTEFQVISN